MGANNSRKSPPVLATSSAPIYCVKKLGGRHLLLGGGGGAAKTGVKNQLEAHLLSFNQTISKSDTGMMARLSSTLDTDKYATMNMDVVCVSNPESGKYLIATGHDAYLDIYETLGYTLDADGQLSYTFNKVIRVASDTKVDGYQKCVRFDKSTKGQKIATGGADGHVRVWDVKDFVNNRNPEIARNPLLSIPAHEKDVSDIDISHDGRLLMSIGDDNKFCLFDMTTGKKIQDIGFPPELATGYKVRSAKFTSLGQNNYIFVVAYNSIQRSSKGKSYLALMGYSRERQVCRCMVLKEVGKAEAVISALCVSPCGNFTGIGLMEGSVGIYDTHELKLLRHVPNTHGIFVTSVEFLDRIASDISMNGPNGARPIPGAAAAYKTCLVSLSADQTVQIHALPIDSSGPYSLYLLKLSIISAVIYLLLWVLSLF